MDRRTSPNTADPVAATAWIDAWMTALPIDQRTTLGHLRETVAAAAPGADEAVSYGIPAYRYHGQVLLWYNAAKAHLSLFPRAASIDRYRDELADFKLSKGTIRFTPTHPLPDDLVRRLVADRVAEIDGAERS
jgi:uncharacterized protein YdhG (YjbR/CyaY superfamily)